MLIFFLKIENEDGKTNGHTHNPERRATLASQGITNPLLKNGEMSSLVVEKCILYNSLNSSEQRRYDYSLL